LTGRVFLPLFRQFRGFLNVYNLFTIIFSGKGAKNWYIASERERRTEKTENALGHKANASPCGYANDRGHEVKTYMGFLPGQT